jgi:hypothetical protein
VGGGGCLEGLPGVCVWEGGVRGGMRKVVPAPDNNGVTLCLCRGPWRAPQPLALG